MSIPTYADLKLELERAADGYRVRVSFRLDSSAAEEDRHARSGTSVSFDLPALRAASSNAQVYGQLLSATLFADDQVRRIFADARAAARAHSIPLRLRLALDAADGPLHSLRWEWLYDPDGGSFLALSERVLLSRYLSGGDGTPIHLPAQAALRALVVVASPRDLLDYNLAAFDGAAERARIQDALGVIPTQVLASGTARPPTLDALLTALRDGYELLIMVGHGTLEGDTPYLWLEQADGRADKIAAGLLAERIQQAQRRPLLAILAACQGAGRDDESEPLVALGPLLVNAGVPAVVAMHGNVSIAAVGPMLPKLISELQRDGCIDQALAAARLAAEREHADWWRPTLSMRVRDGRLWRADGPGQATNTQIAANPFGQSGRIDDPADFFNREHLLERVFVELAKGTNLSLVGEAQVGKSSLLTMIRHHGPQRLGLPKSQFLHLDMQLVRDENDFFEGLCHLLGIPVCRGFALARRLEGKRYILCLDEIEKMRKEHFSGDEREELRGLADGKSAPLTLVIASRAALAELFPDKWGNTSPLANICTPIEVPAFTPAVIRGFIATRLVDTGVTFTDAEIAGLISASGGHPARLQRAAADVYSHYSEPGE